MTLTATLAPRSMESTIEPDPSLQVEEFRGRPEEWDDFVRSQPGWTHFHLYGWKGVMTGTYGHECPYLAARDAQGVLQGVLPLARVRSLIFGHYLVSMCFLNYGGPLGVEPAIRALIDRAVAMARKDNVKLLELRSRTPLPTALAVSHRKVAVVLDLDPGGPEATWQRLTSKARNQVRRTEKGGVTVRFGLEEIDSFYQVFSRRMHELGTPTHTRRLFEAVAAAFPDSAWFGCAYFEGRPLACGCGLQWRDEIEITWGSAIASPPELRPNRLLYWAFMERAAAMGLRRFNFGRATPGSSNHDFKRQWGNTRDEPLYWYGLSSRPGTTTPSPAEASFSWGPRIWKRLPAPLAAALGPSIVRGIP